MLAALVCVTGPLQKKPTAVQFHLGTQKIPPHKLALLQISTVLCASIHDKKAVYTILYQVFHMGKISSESPTEHYVLRTFLA